MKNDFELKLTLDKKVVTKCFELSFVLSLIVPCTIFSFEPRHSC